MNQEFYEFLESHLKNGFEYGKMDCAIFAAKSVLTIQKDNDDLIDLLNKIDGKYEKEGEGINILLDWIREKGIEVSHNPFEDVLNYLFGDSVTPLNAKTGDVVLGDWGEGESFGIVEGARIVAVSESGLVRLRLNKARVAWNI